MSKDRRIGRPWNEAELAAYQRDEIIFLVRLVVVLECICCLLRMVRLVY